MISMTLPQYRRRECTVDGRTVRIKGAHCVELVALLLASHPDHRWTMGELIGALWPNPDFEPDWAESIIAVRIHRLRAKGIPIESDWGFGWRIPRHAREAMAEPERMAA